jgi:protein-S-isoprenylcysteine O-methyltransferase Ste14
MTLNRKDVFVKFLPLPLVYALVVFLPAGTLNYWEAWVSLVVYVTACVALTIWLMNYDPALLERRMKVGPGQEERLAQRVVIWALFVVVAAIYVVSALDHRFGWSHVPPWAVIAGDATMAWSFWLFYLVLKENSFAAATVRVEKGQEVIDTGPYAVVRHPMYVVALVMMASIAVSLGSYWGVAVSLLLVPILHFRIVDEERMLDAELAGYLEYKQRVKWRLVPGVY